MNLELSAGRGERILSFGKYGEEKEKERNLGRLSRLGIVADYVVDYGRKCFTVVIDRFTVAELEDKLEEYVSRSEPGQVADVKKQLQARLHEAEDKVEAHAQVAAEILVDYLYSSVEQARRRAIYETVLMARTCEDDQKIRRKMLDYLHEGKGTEKIVELLKAGKIQWGEWLLLFDAIKSDGQMEAERLRNMFSRELLNNPEHPALLLSRAVAEAISDDGKFEVVERDVRKAIGVLPKYVTSGDLNSVLDSVAEWIRLVEGKAGGGIARVVQWIYWQPLEESSAHEQAFAERVQKWGARQHEELLAKLFHVRDAVHKLGAITTTWVDTADRIGNGPKSA